jgi:two-component system sensor histidine kinase PilS (NtrC family)
VTLLERGSKAETTGARNLILVRTGITFALLASVVSVHFQQPELLLGGEFQFLYAAVVLSYGWLLLRYAFWNVRVLPPVAAIVQAVVDVGFVSIIVFATGLFDSVFTFMYVVVILLGSMELFMQGAISWAMLAAASWTVLLFLQKEGVIHPPGVEPFPIGWGVFIRSVTTNSVGFLLTGFLAGMLGRDISQTRQRILAKEEDLQKLELFNTCVVENIPSGIVTAGIDGRIGMINDVACGILGVSRESVAGKPIETLFGESFASDRRDDNRVSRPEMSYRRADGAELYLGFSASPIKDPANAVIGRVVIFQDLTPIKQMEERVRIADRLAGVGELAAGLAHEIRNPLASIAGASQMLHESGELPPESHTLLDIIGRESGRLNGLITEFLEFAGPVPRDMKPVDLASLSERVADAVRAGEAREKGVSIEARELRSRYVEGDAEQLSQVLWNLLRNAVQATPRGGRVSVDLFPQVRHGERFAVLTVNDTGSGITPSLLGKIYNPFFTTKEGGTGLGLAISQRIVVTHRGFLEVRSVPGEGTVFSVLIPEMPERGDDAIA